MLKNYLENFSNSLFFKFGVIIGNTIGILLISLYFILICWSIKVIGFSEVIYNFQHIIKETLYWLGIVILIFGTIPLIITSLVGIILIIIDIFQIFNNKINSNLESIKEVKTFKFSEIFGLFCYFLSILYSLGWLFVIISK